MKVNSLQLSVSGSVVALAPRKSNPAFERHCYDWTRSISDYTRVNPKGVSAQTRAEIDMGRTTPIRDQTPEPPYPDGYYVRGIPDTCRMLETRYSTSLKAKGWENFILDIWQMEVPEMTRDQLYQAYLSVYDEGRAYNNKQSDAQDAIVAAGATVMLTGNKKSIGGREWLEIVTFGGDGHSPSRWVTPSTFPYLFFRTTNSRRKGYLRGLLWEREDIVETWWQLNGRDIYIPLLSPTGRN